MENAAKLVTAFAALLNAIAWPIAFLIAFFVFRIPIQEQLKRLRKGKVGFFEVELEQIATIAAQNSSTTKGEITVEQIHSAARIEARSNDIGETELLYQLEKLCIEYDTLKRVLPPSSERTAAMTRIVVQMRVVGPSVAHRVNVYKNSGSPGSRLAAIAIMQMNPESSDIPWLVRRFREDAPFVFFHAALALRNLANEPGGATRDRVKLAAMEALKIMESFEGEPDRNSVAVLKSLL